MNIPDKFLQIAQLEGKLFLGGERGGLPEIFEVVCHFLDL